MLNFCCGNCSREETIQERKLYEEIGMHLIKIILIFTRSELHQTYQNRAQFWKNKVFNNICDEKLVFWSNIFKQTKKSGKI